MHPPVQLEGLQGSRLLHTYCMKPRWQACRVPRVSMVTPLQHSHTSHPSISYSATY